MTAAFRCFVPGEAEYEQAVLRAASLGLALKEIDFLPAGNIEFGENVEIKQIDQHWLLYLVTKAAWRMESSFRTDNGGPEDPAHPSLAEEFVAVAVTAGAYANSLEPDEESPAAAQEVQREPGFDRLLDAISTEHYRGFVLYEVVHKAYGVTLDRLTDEDAAAVNDYLFQHVIYRKSVE